jgi:hypothetical protein
MDCTRNVLPAGTVYDVAEVTAPACQMFSENSATVVTDATAVADRITDVRPAFQVLRGDAGVPCVPLVRVACDTGNRRRRGAEQVARRVGEGDDLLIGDPRCRVRSGPGSGRRTRRC